MTVIHWCPRCCAMFTGRAHKCLTRYPSTGLEPPPR